MRSFKINTAGRTSELKIGRKQIEIMRKNTEVELSQNDDSAIGEKFLGL
jgi:hypothetical protein